MEDVAEIIADLVKEGVSPELIGRVAAALVSVTERNAVTRNVTLGVTPAAARMRRMRERKASENNVLDVEKTASVAVTERNGVTSQSVTSYNNISISSDSLEEEKKDIIVRSVTRKRNSYAQDFEIFWTAFPTDAGMSKLEASKAWEKLPPEDRQAASEAIPAFKAWVSQQGPNYRTVHACRYITQRRFEGFKAQAEKTQEVVSNRVYVITGTDAMDAWDAYFKRTKGKLAPRDQRGGWWFESEYPPQQEKAA
jgi:hypothetical protein